MIKIPACIEWETWRIVASERFAVSLVEVETQWTLKDVAQAHDILDLLQL